MGLKAAFSIAVILSLAAAYPAEIEEERVLEAIRSGKLKVTDELIETQRKQRPELKALTNQEIRDRLEKRANKSGSDTAETEPVPQAEAKPPAGAGKPGPADEGSRFPAGLTRFGYDFFSNNAAASLGGGNTPALPEYVLSPGDEIQIYTWGRENQSQTVVVDNEGMFHYPPLQPMRLAGMKFASAQQLLTKEIEKISGVKASVGLGKLKSIRIFVLGEAMSPGSYVVPAGATVTTALFQSGGIRDIGSLRAIQLKRGGKVIATLDLYEMLLRGNSRSDQQLLTGDVIFVPVAPIQVAVTGMVKRPGIYEVKPGTKVLETLDLAGGLSSNAFKGRVRLDRVENHRRKVALDVGMEKVGGNQNVSLQDGDILNVEEVLAREYDVVYLEGNVNRPGRYEYKKGMTIRDLIPSVRDLKSETFFSYGHIKRSTEDDQGSLLLPFSLKDVFEQNASVPLAPRDTVVVYNRFDIMDKPEVKISGTVRRPGRYPYVDRMMVSDLIIAGGGLTSEAYLPEAHVIRPLRIQESDSLYSTLLKVNLSNLIDNPGDGNNLLLQPFDSLIIFPRNNFVLPKHVSIHGAVKREGFYELTQNLGIPELIKQADGLTKTTFKLRIEVVRRYIEKDSLVRRDILQLSLKDILEGRKRFDLQDGDAVYVREVVDNHGQMTVILNGEFNFPGRYQVAKGERLGSIIRRAGGFTREAYTRGAVFIRRSVKDRQLRAIEDINRRLDETMNNLLSQTTNEKDRASLQETIAQRRGVLDEAKVAPYLGRVVVELDARHSFEGRDGDLLLEDGDSLHVGFQPNVVSIMGEVYSPTSVIFGSGNNTVSECLGKAGGINEYGDAKNIFYVKPDGSVITPKNTSFFGWRRVEPGGAIVVPPKGPAKDRLDALAKVTQIIYQVAIAVGVVSALIINNNN